MAQSFDMVVISSGRAAMSAPSAAPSFTSRSPVSNASIWASA